MQREQLLKAIRTASNTATVDEMEKMLIRLRGLTIKTVEMIVLWRDQFRYFALMLSKGRLARKKKAHQAIQTPYLTDPVSSLDQFCDNYLIKLRYDTKDFSEMKLISENFNVFNGKLADTFLLHMSLT